MRIVLANSVGLDRRGYYLVHSPSRWSWGVNNYREIFTYYPWELAYTSSLLKKETTHPVTLIDGCLHKLNAPDLAREISGRKPDLVIMEPSARTIEEDGEAARQVKKDTGATVVFCGAYASANGSSLRAAAAVDHTVTGEYEYSILDLARGLAPDQIPGFDGAVNNRRVDFSRLPWPEDDDVSRYAYAVPGEPNCEYREIQAYASRGCVYQCAFCAATHLYYGESNWRGRRVDDVAAEITHLRGKYPAMQGIFFDEEWHNFRKDFILDLCRELRARQLGELKYNAMCGYATLDREMMEAMKAAGYYKLRIGIETVSEATAAGLNLGGKFNLKKLYENLELAREIGMKIYGTFTIGGKGSSRDEDLRTAEFIRESVGRGWITDLQVSISTPQPGTPYYQWAKQNGYILRTEWSDFDGGSNAVVSYPGYPRESIEEMFQLALLRYDQGRYERDRSEISGRMVTGLRNLSLPPGPLLAFRSHRLWHVWCGLDALAAFRPGVNIDMIVQPAVRDLLAQDSRIRHAYVYDRGFFNAAEFPPALREEIRKQNYAAAVVFGNHPAMAGYDDIFRIAADCGIGTVIYLYPDGRATRQGRVTTLI